MYSLVVENIKCIIAAGGLGTRLQEFRGNKSTKILLDVNGTPMINRQISQLVNWGMRKFVIITNPEYFNMIQEVTLGLLVSLLSCPRSPLLRYTPVFVALLHACVLLPRSPASLFPDSHAKKR